MVIEDKELIKKIRRSFHEKKSRAEITRKLQERGYKLEYIDKLISKAKKPKKIILSFSIVFLIIFLISLSTYLIIFEKEKQDVKNPLERFVLDKNSDIENINITSELPTYFLNELGAWKLHKNPLTLDDPIINFKIGEKNFYSEIKKEINSFEGNSENADIKFIFTKEDVIKAILSENPAEYLRGTFKDGKAQIEKLKDDKVLFAKGYLTLYETLKE